MDEERGSRKTTMDGKRKGKEGKEGKERKGRKGWEGGTRVVTLGFGWNGLVDLMEGGGYNKGYLAMSDGEFNLNLILIATHNYVIEAL